MPHHLMRCSSCRKYTISEKSCPKCGATLESVYPARFSIEDKYQKYRLDYFKEKMKKKFADLGNKP